MRIGGILDSAGAEKFSVGMALVLGGGWGGEGAREGIKWFRIGCVLQEAIAIARVVIG